MFHGALYVANSAFNNLGFPLLATAFNWGKATLGTIPFAMAGARSAARRRAAGAGRRRGAVRPRLDGCGLLGGGKAYAKSAAGWTFILNARQFPLLPGML